MRGTPEIKAELIAAGRFIPAHAGNTVLRCHRRPYQPVHPRACGEHSSRMRSATGWVGSSPRMRGTRFTGADGGAACRFIPAHAGNTTTTGHPCRLSAVHPRACGEHFIVIRKRTLFSGSSPRMRGTPTLPVLARRCFRFIPAHAGNTARCILAEAFLPVHPRACGEHGPQRLEMQRVRGSSPRMRGTLWPIDPHRPCKRFIPAHAGNTD